MSPSLNCCYVSTIFWQNRSGRQLAVMTTKYETAAELLARVIADKAARRLRERAKSWPEKIASIERVREVSRTARAAMLGVRRRTAR